MELTKTKLTPCVRISLKIHMHNFSQLVYNGATFTLNALEELNSKSLAVLQTSSETSAIKNLQMIQLQKSILAIGMFSLFDSILQQELSCENGFIEAKKLLLHNNKVALHDNFNDFLNAINVLKHGRGRSYNELFTKYESLPFRLKLPTENFFDDGDVSEVATLIEIDDKFVLTCAKVIEEVYNELNDQFRV